MHEAKNKFSNAPMPLILAIAPCGAVTKGFTGTFEEKKLETAFVSPGMQHTLKGLQNRKLVFVCIVNQVAPNGKATIPQAVKDFQADQRFDKATEIVFVKGGDKEESEFLKNIKVGDSAGLFVLLAPPGAMIGTFNEYSTKELIVEKLIAAMSSSCGGGKCGPNGCGPKE